MLWECSFDSSCCLPTTLFALNASIGMLDNQMTALIAASVPRLALTDEERAQLGRIFPLGVAAGTRYPAVQMPRVNR